MRRSIAAAAVSLAVGITVLTTGSPTVAAGSDAGSTSQPDARPAAGPSTRPTAPAERALSAARGALGATDTIGPDAPHTGLGAGPGAALVPDEGAARRSGRPDATLALRDLFAVLPRLDADGRSDARGILARPTDGDYDPLGNGYTVPARRKCDGHFCIHWVPRTADAPPSRAWVNTSLATMNAVWRKEVGNLGYRKPATDGRRGGNSLFDVYLKDLGSQGLYGYCAPERRVKGHKWLASGYCVLDNDFAKAQYGAPPVDSLRVTAAHEFFHAVQFNYDYGEDPWLMEATSTWMEERFADAVNDNRQYLPFGQVGSPAQPLDTFRQSGFNQYGNWPFFEYLSDRFGAGIVRGIWNRAGSYPGAPDQYSTAAVRSALARHGGFSKVYRGFAAGNTMPGRTYPEGRSWPAAPASATWTLSTSAPSRAATLRISHMASRNVLIRPGAGVTTKAWRLRISVDGPGARTAPTAMVVIKRRHGVTTKAVSLDRDGKGQASFSFGSRRVRSATVTLVNASTRFSCWHGTTGSCQGRARDNREPFTISALVRR